jgi:membrane protein DedA with SNARE-associated domain
MPYLTHYWQWVYLFVLLVAFLESFIFTAFFVPWSTIIVLISFFSVQNWIDLKMIFLSWFIWVLTGNIISYYIWLNYNKKKLDKVFRIIKLESIQKTKKVIENNAFKTLTIWRLVPVFKEVIFFLSGVNQMNFYGLM